MLGALTTKLSTLMYYDKFSDTINDLRQQKLVNVIYAYYLPMLGALTTNPCTVMFYNCRNLSTSVQEKRKETSK